MHCQPDIVVPILRHFKTRSVFSTYSDHYFVIWPELIRKASREVDEKVSVQFSQNISKHEVNILEAAVGSRYFILRRLSCGIVPLLFEFIIKCSPTSASCNIAWPQRTIRRLITLDNQRKWINSVGYDFLKSSVPMSLFQLIYNPRILKISGRFRMQLQF